MFPPVSPVELGHRSGTNVHIVSFLGRRTVNFKAFC